MSSRPRATAASKARAARIAAALADLLEDVPPVPVHGEGGDPYRGSHGLVPPPRPRASLACPACGGRLQLEPRGGIEIHGCVRCHGLWLDPGELEAMTASSSEPGGVPSVAELRQHMQDVAPRFREVHYRRCPRCREVMHRRNYGSLSGVIVDECPRHGMFLDSGEFEAIETFIRVGGLALQRQRLEQRIHEQRRKATRPEPEHVTTSQRATSRADLWLALLEILFS